MVRLAGYELSELRHQGPRTLVYSAVRARDAQKVILKASRNAQPTRAEVARLRAEYEIGRSVDHPGIVKYLEIAWEGHRPVLVLEDFEGRALSEQVATGLGVGPFLALALQLVEGLGALHARRVIHKDLNPANIIHNPGNGLAKLTDFSISSLLERESVRGRTPQDLEGTLAYISPEQTGRMNRSIDYRTDFYSLGVTFYELLSGKLPFESDDPVQLVHAHLAQVPPDLALHHPEVPEQLARIVAKLLAKTAEERYQSAAGLLADLRRCADDLARGGAIGAFELGLEDASGRLQIPEKLYGRRRQIDQLLSCFARAADGSRELFTVAGQAGSGKSALVHEIQRCVFERRGAFIRGKYDQLQRDIPHSAFIEAVGELVQLILTRPEAEVKAWRARLLAALGDEGQVLVDALPEIELVIGPQSPVPSLPPVEAEHRFNRLARRFFRTVAAPDHPLVIFLDDLQWADAASLHLLELLLADDDVHHLLIVGAYRLEDVDATHPLSITLEAVKRGPVEVSQVVLGPLQAGHVAKLLAETLKQAADEVQLLAEIVSQRTQGNPFFVNQFVQSLYNDGELRFDPARARWAWDCDLIASRMISEDVVSFLLRQMARLPAETQAVLDLAACVGGRFDLGTLSIIAEESPFQVAASLRPAVDGGIVRALDGAFARLLAAGPLDPCSPEQALEVRCAFVHDRFQQACYSRIPAERRLPLHLRLGRLLRAHLGASRLDERLFEVVNHFVAGKEAIADSGERLLVAQLNYRAGIKAKAAAAYASAQRHFAAGIELLPEEQWDDHYRLSFELRMELFECLVFESDAGAKSAQPLGSELLERAANPVDHMRALALYIVVLSRAGSPERGLELGIDTLRRQGLDLAPDGLEEAVRERYDALRSRLAGRAREELVSAPLMSDPHHIALIELVRCVLVPMYMRRRELVPLAEMVTLGLTLDRGVTLLSGMAYAGVARVAAHTFGDFELGYELSQVGKALCDRVGAFRSAVRGLSAGLIEWIKDSLHVVVERAREAFRLGVETGEPFYPALIASYIPSLALSAGHQLDELYEQTKPFLRFAVDRMGDIGVREGHLNLWLIEALRGERNWRSAFFADEVEAARALEVMRVRNAEGAAWYHLQQARLAYLFDDVVLARTHIEAAAAVAEPRIGAFAARDLVFVHALVLARAAGVPASGDEIARVSEKLGQLEALVEAGAGANFKHKALIVRAELARLRGDGQVAANAYEAAIEAAQAARFVQDQALANELAGRFYLARGLEKVARVYLNDARYGYETWGARAKCAQLVQAHRWLRETGTAEISLAELTVSSASTIRATTTAHSQWLDFASVMKASRAISSELVLDALLQRLLSIVVESAGAERGALVLRRDTRLMLEATCDAQGAKLVGGRPIERADDLPAGIVNYVARTQQPIVLEDAAGAGHFRTDPYVVRQRLQSVLCASLSTQGRLVGVIYLENNLARGVFTAQRLEVVNLLCAQAGISIEQARLYAELERTNKQLEDYSRTLEQQVERRTHDLAQKNEQLNATLQRVQQMQNQLLISEKMASLGNLVAGVAHEINTPIGAVVSSVDTTRRCVARLRGELGRLAPAESSASAGSFGRLLQLLEDNIEVIGTAGARVSEIVRTLRSFARLDEAERKPADLHEGLEGTLTLARHRLGRSIDVVRDYGAIEPVLCYPNELNQVFMNLLVNAIDAIEARRERTGSREAGSREAESREKGTITIRTWQTAGRVFVEIKDDGAGIPAAVLPRIFDPGFTTKGVGVGTGLGLSICFNIVEKHGGTISVDSLAGEGTSVRVALPVKPPTP